jgi:2,3-bisphosphoglycerate-dependent phosphoglycerate mutase
MDNVLVLVRHGQSEWNAKNLFTGWKDVGLTEKGIAEARKGGALLKAEGIKFDIAYTSALSRAHHTLEIILEELGQRGLETIKDQALNERDYGNLVGLNKDDAREKWGPEQVHIWRRSFDTPPPGGESLKDTAERVLPYFQAKILPDVLAGKNVIVSAHGNSLRALIMRLDNLSPDEVTKLELATGVPMIYRLNKDGTVAEKRDLAEAAA